MCVCGCVLGSSWLMVAVIAYEIMQAATTLNQYCIVFSLAVTEVRLYLTSMCMEL